MPLTFRTRCCRPAQPRAQRASRPARPERAGEARGRRDYSYGAGAVRLFRAIGVCALRRPATGRVLLAAVIRRLLRLCRLAAVARGCRTAANLRSELARDAARQSG